MDDGENEDGSAPNLDIKYSSGITSGEAAELLIVHGRNELPEKHKAKVRLRLRKRRGRTSYLFTYFYLQ